MLQEADDDVPLGEGGASSLVTAATQLKKSGAFDQARALLEGADRDADEGAAMLYVGMLDRLDDHVTMQATVSDMVRRLNPARAPSPSYLAFLLRHAERACIDVALIGEALEYSRPRAHGAAFLDVAYPAVRRRQNFRLRRAALAQRATIISLGMHCLPWTLINRWGFRTPAQFVDDFNPFCLAIHKIPGIIAALKTDFEDYLAPNDIMVVKSALGHPVALRRDRTAIWNHNQGLFWMENDCAALRANMSQKIANFRRTCRAEAPVFLIGNCLDDYPKMELKFLPALKEALQAATGRPRNRLIITNQRAAPPGDKIFHIDDETSFVYCPYPDKSYIWFDPKSIDSVGGMAYELGYVKSLFLCLRRWKLTDPPREIAAVTA
jgi:hypothetical protein